LEQPWGWPLVLLSVQQWEHLSVQQWEHPSVHRLHYHFRPTGVHQH
jgi:hypothetical protein